MFKHFESVWFESLHDLRFSLSKRQLKFLAWSLGRKELQTADSHPHKESIYNHPHKGSSYSHQTTVIKAVVETVEVDELTPQELMD